jgi:hypothetical protein
MENVLMTVFPRTYTPQHPGSIFCGGHSSVGDDVIDVGNAFSNANVNLTASRAHYIPFIVRDRCTVYGSLWLNGSTISGNLDVGIYDYTAVRLVSLGATAQAGASAVQYGNLADTTLDPGYYWMAFVADNATATFSVCSWTAARPLDFMGIKIQASAYVLPSTATFATSSVTEVPRLVLLTDAAV